MSAADKMTGAGLRLRADLHTHSIYSDGMYTPKELCLRAKENGVGLLSITDHDTMNGEAEKRAAAEQYGLQYVSGWEISAYLDECKIHITGYGCSLDGAYADFMAARVRLAYERAEDSIEKLKSVGVFLTLDDAKAERADPSAPLHTMHIARAAAKKSGMNFGEIYEKFLAPGKVAHSAIGRPTPYEAIDCIHASGGIASVAHPGRIAMRFEEREKLLLDLAAYGVDGIEAYYSTHTEEETKYFEGVANRLGLLVTGGSDTHYDDPVHRVGYPLFYPSEKLLLRLGITER
jgi:hypothetical protein